MEGSPDDTPGHWQEPPTAARGEWLTVEERMNRLRPLVAELAAVQPGDPGVHDLWLRIDKLLAPKEYPDGV